MTETEPKSAPRTATIVSVAVVAGLGFGLAAVYGIGGLQRNAGAAGNCSASIAAAARIKPLVKGEVAALIPADAQPLLVSGLAFNGSDGKPVALSAWKGKTLLVNLWATWCVPCRKEMPALDRLQASSGSDKFEVVAINLDTKDPEKPKQFLSEIGVAALGYHADPTLGVFKALQQKGKSRGLPTTMLVGPDGCEIGTMNGPAEWDSADAKAVIKAAMGN